RIVGVDLSQYEVAVPVDRRQHVVEVVGHAAGEDADRFELLRLTELLLARTESGLCGYPFADVAADPLNADRLAVLKDESGIYLDRDATAVLCNDLGLIDGRRRPFELHPHHLLGAV